MPRVQIRPATVHQGWDSPAQRPKKGLGLVAEKTPGTRRSYNNVPLRKGGVLQTGRLAGWLAGW